MRVCGIDSFVGVLQLKGIAYALVEYVSLPLNSLHESLRPRSYGGSGQLVDADVRLMLLNVSYQLALQSQKSSTLTAVFQQPRFLSGDVYPTALVRSQEQVQPTGTLSSVGYVISTSDASSGDHLLSTLLTQTAKLEQMVVFENAHFSVLGSAAVAARIQQIDQSLSSPAPAPMPSPKTSPAFAEPSQDSDKSVAAVILPQNRSAAVNMLLAHTRAMDTSHV
jgi:hypothetical protein